MKADINPKRGFGELKFGQGVEQTMKIMGRPSEVEQIGEEVEMPTTVLHYDESGISLFFDTAPEEILVCMNIEDPDTVLFGEGLPIIFIVCSTPWPNFNASAPDRDKEEWGEERLGYEEFSIDFYFTDDELESVTIGK